MIVGFIITDFGGHEKEAVEFISSVCILDPPDVAKNIVAQGTGIPVFSQVLSTTLLDAQPFSVSYIEVTGNECVVTPIVNFLVECPFENNTLRLSSVEYIKIDRGLIEQLYLPRKQGLLTVIPDDWFIKRPVWILADNFWNDSGVWIDSDVWND